MTDIGDNELLASQALSWQKHIAQISLILLLHCLPLSLCWSELLKCWLWDLVDEVQRVLKGQLLWSTVWDSTVHRVSISSSNRVKVCSILDPAFIVSRSRCVGQEAVLKINK